MPVVLDEFIPVRLSTIDIDSVLAFDLYQNVAGKPILYRNKNRAISQLDLRTLSARGCEELFIPQDQKREWLQHILKHLPAIISNKSVPVEDKVASVSHVSQAIVQEVLQNPDSADSHKATARQSYLHVRLALLGGRAQHALVTFPVKDHPLVTHILAVTNLSIVLALRCGFRDPEQLRELSLAAALHDIGKVIISSEYLNNPEIDAEQSPVKFRSYPSVGAEVLQKSGVIPKGVLGLVMEHQERLDGSGYPNRLRAANLSAPGRILGIVNHYDEVLNLSRSSSKMTPFSVLLKMRQQPTKYDQKILAVFIRLLGTDMSEIQ